jgi:hypothetical protein
LTQTDHDHDLMPFLSRLFWVPVLLVAGHVAVAQFILEGEVVDGETGTPLAAVSVHIDGTTRGTVTNTEGRFRLWNPSESAIVEFRHVAFEPERIGFEKAPAGAIRVSLQPMTYRMSVWEVTAEDPAVGIMREVIRRKGEWMGGLHSWSADAYTRFVARNDTGIVALSESAARAFWRREQGMREVVLANRSSDNLNPGGLLPAAAFVRDFYQDEIELAGYRFPGVTHPDALKYYDFRLLGVQKGEERRSIRIEVRPRSAITPLFRGTVLVVDSLYALEEVQLAPNEAFRFPIPVKSYRVSYTQQFREFSDRVWLPVDFRSEGEVEIAIPGLRFPAVRFDQVSRISDYAINGETPDSLYASRRVAVRAPDEVPVPDLSALVEIVPLTAEERRAYAVLDSTRELADAFRPRGLLARFVTVMSGSDRSERRSSSGRKRGATVTPRVWYNRVEAMHLGIGVGTGIGPVRASVEGGWSTELRRPDFAGRLSVSGSKRGWTANASHLRGAQTRLQSTYFGRPWAGLALLLGSDDYFDYYWRTASEAGLAYATRARTPLEVGLSFRSERHESLAGRGSYDLVGRRRPQRHNPAIRDGTFQSLTFRSGVGRERSPFWGTRRVALETEVGWGETVYGRYRAEVDWRFRTFHRRRPRSNTLDLRGVVGGTSGEVPPQRFHVVEGGLLAVHPFGTLRTLRGRPLEGEQFFAGFWEHDFRSVPFERIGLSGLADLGMGLVLHGAHAYTFVRGTTKGSLDFPVHVTGGVHHEVGISLTNVLGIPLRVDLTERLSRNRGFYVGVGVSRLL